MALTNNNVQNVKFLRNGALYTTHDEAYEALTGFTLTTEQDGTIILARYGSGNNVKTLAGLIYADNSNQTITIIDVEGASSDVEKLRQEINAKLGEGVTSANTATAQFEALSGGTFTPGTSSSADTSVEGAKAYAYDLIATLDGSVTAENGYYVKSVSEVDGKISGTTEALPSSNDTAVAKKFVIAVDETNGKIEVSRGEITSSAKTIVLNDNTDSGVDFDVNIDGTSIVKDANGVLSVASTALTQYVGDEKTIHISSADTTTNAKTVSTLLSISSTTPSETNVKEQYNLVNASGETIGATIKIYKDSSLYNVYLGHMDDTIAGDPPVVTSGTGDTALCFIYHKEDGSYALVPVNVESFLEESEFESGVTATNHIVHGVVDPDSEKDSQDIPVDFLTVGADGFKISGIKAEINKKLGDIVGDLDATVTGKTANQHVSISIEELDGKLVQSGLTITESNIANADDLAALSGKTITDINSANGSITVTPADAADGTQEIDLATDASKIKMSGLTDTTGTKFSGLTQNSSVTDAINKIITNDGDIAAEIKELREDIDAVSGDVKTISGDVDTIKEQYISGVSVNNKTVAITDKIAKISVESSTSAMTATSTEAIVVDTDANGNITLGLASIDCGTYN